MRELFVLSIALLFIASGIMIVSFSCVFFEIAFNAKNILDMVFVTFGAGISFIAGFKIILLGVSGACLTLKDD